MLLERKNKENRKSYAEVLKGMNHGQPKSKKTNKDTYSRRPITLVKTLANEKPYKFI